MLQSFFTSLNLIIWIVIGIFILIYFKKTKDYKSSAYYQITKIPYHSIGRDLGRYGEYLTYKYLKSFEKQGAKFLFNVYIPKGNGETSEIDVLMLSKKGIFVLESKNYSGWIFGDESHKNWYQTLRTKKGNIHKESFYNPIMQNQTHIKHLNAFLGKQLLTHSIIVFSERCTLKDIIVSSNNIHVIKRNQLASLVSNIYKETTTDVLTETDITNLYHILYPCTQVNDTAKQQHIADIERKLAQKSAAESKKAKNVSQKEPKEAKITKPDEKTSKNQVCPKCGGNLVLRTAAKGNHVGNQFWGCTNYPKCRYTRNLEKEEAPKNLKNSN